MSNNTLRSLTAASMALLATSVASAESLSDRRAAKDKIEVTELEVACGRMDKENCAVVVPSINERVIGQFVRLKPLESKGSVESMDALCDGDINAAVVQADVYLRRSLRPDCAGKTYMVGSPLYPYEDFAIVRNGTKGSSLNDLIERLNWRTHTRLGDGSIMCISGDPGQDDLDPGMTGLADLVALLEKLKDPKIAIVKFEDNDSVRHALVTRILPAMRHYGPAKLAHG